MVTRCNFTFNCLHFVFDFSLVSSEPTGGVGSNNRVKNGFTIYTAILTLHIVERTLLFLDLPERLANVVISVVYPTILGDVIEVDGST